MSRVATVSHLWFASFGPPACGSSQHPGGGESTRLPLVGLGVAGNLDQDVLGTADAVERWLRLGGRAIDTALMYNNNAGVRLGIERSGVPRRTVVLTTKVPPERMGYASTLAALEQARSELGVEVLDCALIHWPGRTWAKRSSDPECVVDRGASLGADWSGCRRESWAALLEAKRSGLVRAAGVANFEPGHLRELQAAPEVLQAELHPWWRREDLLNWCRGAGAQLVAYASLGSSGAAEVMGDPLLSSIAWRHGVTAAQVLLQWAVSRGVATIPSARSEHHMRENLGCCDGWALSPEEDLALSSIPVADQYRAILPDPRFVFSPLEPSQAAAVGARPLAHRRLDLFGAVDETSFGLRGADAPCWGGEMQRYPCCHPGFGPLGLESCWDGEYDFQRCCASSGAAGVLSLPVLKPGAHTERRSDFVVVGAGSGGSAAAAALAAQGFHVLLVDSGGWDSLEQYSAHPNPSDPKQEGRWFSTEIEWELGSAIRRVQQLSGRGLGGSSAVNGHIYQRTALPFAKRLVTGAYRRVEASLTLRYSGVATQVAAAERRMLDMFAAAGVPHLPFNLTSPRVGIGPVLRSVGCMGEVGASSSYYCAVAWLNDTSSSRGDGGGQVEVVPGIHAESVILRDRRAVGVQAVGGASFWANHGVLVCAGALQTPLLLARSGVGHPKELARIGVPVRIPSLDVGSHLQDHPYLPLQVDTGLSCDVAHAHQELFGFYHALPENRSGHGAGPFDIELQLSPQCEPRRGIPEEPRTLRYKVFLILLRSQTVARVVPRSADPGAPPLILFDPFAAGGGGDAWRLIQHARDLYRLLLRSLAEQGPWLAAPAVLDPPPEVLFDDRGAGQYCAQRLGLWQHPSGTAGVGRVLDARLAVLGATGLRVADGSALPRSAEGHPDAATRALGHLAARFATEDARAP